MQTKFRYKFIINIILILLCATFVIPLVYVISLSVTPENLIRNGGYKLIPKEIDFTAYKVIFKQPKQLLDSYKITFAYSFLGTFLSVTIMSMIAYAISRRQFYYRQGVTFFVYFTMLFSGGLVPSYIINTSYLGLSNSFWAYIFPHLVAPYYVLLLRTFFKNLPESLAESAKIDGASELKIFLKIALPLSKPAIATVSFIMLLAKWSDWNTSLLYILDQEKYSLQYLLQKVLREAALLQGMANNAETAHLVDRLSGTTPVESMRFAMAILAAGPMMVIFPFFQKYFTKGLTVGAVKG